MDDLKENKTKESQIKAVRESDKRNGKTTIACKVTVELKEMIEKKAGNKSVNAYLLGLIKKDLEQQNN